MKVEEETKLENHNDLTNGDDLYPSDDCHHFDDDYIAVEPDKPKTKKRKVGRKKKETDER